MVHTASTFSILFLTPLPMIFGSQLFDRHLEDDEHLVAIVHKHWLLGVQEFFWPLLSFIGGWAFLYLAPFMAMLYVVAGWTIFSLVWLLRNFYDYYLDAWIITDQGVIDVGWHGWFHRESTRVLYSDIQGVSYEIEGVVGTLVRYGTVSIEKISTGSVISLDHVPKPRTVEAMILKNMEKYLHSKNLSDAKHVQELLSTLVAREVQLQQFGDEDDDDEE